MSKFIVSIEFDDTRIAGMLELNNFVERLDRPEEYFIAPSAQWDEIAGKFQIVGYSLVHVSHIPSATQLYERTREISFPGGTLNIPDFGNSAAHPIDPRFV